MKSHLSMVCWLFVGLCCVIATAQPPAIQWTRSVHAGAYIASMPIAAIATDGGFVMASSVRQNLEGAEDFCLVKLAANGDSLWTRFYGGAGAERLETVIRTFDGGYVLAGMSTSWNSDGDGFVVRTDAQGHQLWTSRLEGTIHYDYKAVAQTADSGFLLSSYPSQLVKLSAAGNLEWMRSCAGIGIYTISSIVVLPDGYLLAGDGYRAIRLNLSGDTLWTRGDASPAYEECHSAQQTSDGGFVLAGWLGVQPPLDTWYTSWHMIKLNAGGAEEWTRDYLPDYSSECYSVRQTADGGYLLASSGPVGVLRVNSAGDSLWTLGSYAESAQQAPDGGFIYSYTADGGMALTKTYPEILGASPEAAKPTGFALNQNYPNPFNPSTQISFDLPHSGFAQLQIFDVNGRLVSTLASGMLNQGRHVQIWNAAGVASGTYIYRLKTSDYSSSRSMILLK